MIITIQSDLLAVKRGLIVHGCNAQGVMGAGVAAQVAKKWPLADDAYMTFCQQHNDNGVGMIHFVVLDRDGAAPYLVLVNAITQRVPGVGKQVSYDAIDSCFTHVARLARKHELPIHFPLIGCGLAGGKWPIVASIIEENTHGIDKFLHVL